MSTLLSDIRLAIRSLLQRPVFTAVILLTLALGIGANTAIFSVVNGVLLRPLPYRAPEGLVLIWSKWKNFEKTWLSDREYFGYREEMRSFEDVAAWDTGDEVTLTGDQGPESVAAVGVTANLLGLLGAAPSLGRGITAEEDVPQGAAVVLVGDGLWRRRYGGDPGLVGKVIQINGTGHTVVGILPRGFRLPLEFQARNTAQLLLPLRLDPANTSNGHSYYGVARLAPGATPDGATAEMQALVRRWTEEGRYPAAMEFSAYTIPGSEEVNGRVRVALLVLTGAVGLLLLITCANVANLLLTRADARNREMAVRAALGAGRRRLLRLNLTESLVLAVAGGALGLLLAWAGVRLLASQAPTSVPRAGELGLHGAVLGYTVVVTLLTGIIFGLLPALRVSGVNLAATLKEDGRGGESRGRLRGRAILVAAETALAVMLVIGAALMVRSFLNLLSVDPGFETRGILTVRLALPQARFPDTGSRVRFFEQVRQEVAALPGVEAAGFVRVLPLADEIGDADMEIEGRPTAPDEPDRSADWQIVTPGYFEAMRIPLLRGRLFDDTDTPDGAQVIAINETLANEYFRGEDPLGKRIRVGDNDRPWRTIVALVGDTRHHGLTGPVKRQWFIPHNQFANSWGITSLAMTLVLRTGGNPEALLEPVGRAVHRIDPDVPLAQVATMEAVVGTAVQDQRFSTTLMAGFALLALLLAAVGIYAVVSYSVTQRTREIGIRVALGADTGSVRRLVVRQGMAPALAGILVGLAGATALARFLHSLLFGISTLDPPAFLGPPLVLLLVAAGATLLPAIRATRVDPMAALRAE